jgi:hypothetical protein
LAASGAVDLTKILHPERLGEDEGDRPARHPPDRRRQRPARGAARPHLLAQGRLTFHGFCHTLLDSPALAKPAERREAMRAALAAKGSTESTPICRTVFMVKRDRSTGRVQCDH